MILWTIKPEEVFNKIQNNGVYRCDINKSGMKDFADVQYNWMVSQMKKRIGSPPEGVTYPVWAWYKWSYTKRRPDLRAVRWYWGQKGAKFYRLEIEIPDNEVLLSDFDGWAWGILNSWLFSDTEEEDKKIEKFYESLSPEEQKEYKFKNWERVFDISPLDNGWIRRGESIQATFWELRKEHIREVTAFRTEGKR